MRRKAEEKFYTCSKNPLIWGVHSLVKIIRGPIYD